MDMRGLAHFIRDVRKATGNRREEENRVEEELAKIRAKFIDAGHMSDYDRKKYVCKLMFISMLGYPITFGHMEGIKLMAEKTPAEKLIGYLSATVLLNENSELMTLTTHTVYRDLISGSDLNRGLALSLIANSGGKEFAEVMHEGVQQVILDDGVDQHIGKKALLTLLRIHQRYPDVVDLTEVVPKAVDMMMGTQDGVSMCAVEFLNGCISKRNEHLFVGVPAKLLELLSRIIMEKQTEPGYVYYGVPAPWLQCKILRFLQYFPVPGDAALHDKAIIIMRKIIKATDKVLKDAQTQQKQRGAQNRVSVMNAVLFEVVSLAIQWGVGSKVILECVSVISNFISDKREANLRYIGLALLSRLSFVKGVPEFDFQAQCKQYQQQIVVGLHDADVSIRRKALEVLVAMCNPANATDIIKELLTYLPIVPDNTFKGNLVLAIALLSEKYCDDSNMYVDILLTVVAQAGDICPPDVAYRVVHVIVNNASVQKRATSFLFNALRTRKHVHFMLLQVAAFVLGEFGYQIALSAESTPQQQLTLLRAQMDYAEVVPQALILTAFFKFYNLYDDAAVRGRIVDILGSYRTSVHPELQQRATEYLAVIEQGSRELVEKVLEPIPAFPDDVNVALERLRKMRNMHDIWADKLIAREGAKGIAGEGKMNMSKNGKKKGTASMSDGAGGKQVLKLEELYAVKSSAAEASRTGAASAEMAQLDAMFEASHRANLEALRQTYRTHRQLFTTLLVEKQGVLFRDDSVEVRCEQVFHLADCRLALRIVNATTGVLRGLSVELLGAEAGLLVQSRIGEEGRQAMANGLVPGASFAMDVAARSLAPFRDPPSVRLQYGEGTTAAVQTLSLPIVTACFTSPYDADSGEDAMGLYESVKRSTMAATRTLTTAKAHSKEAVLAVLGRHGMQAVTSPQGSIIGVGAHATQPQEKVNYAPVACEVAQTSAATMVSVYATDPDVQQVTLDTLLLSL